MSVLLPEIKKIPDFDTRLIIEACEYLSADKAKADMFLGLDEELRRMWLLMRLPDHE